MRLQLSIATRIFLLRNYVEQRIDTCQQVIDAVGDPYLRQLACISDLHLVLAFLDKILPEGKVHNEAREAGTHHDLLN
jgi:hypothetical protein